jgi:hypothetical protein
MAMITVMGNDVITGAKRVYRPDGNRLLADVQMQKPPDFGTRIQFGTFLFKLPNKQHLAIHLSLQQGIHHSTP